jgi:hypothetical protein
MLLLATFTDEVSQVEESTIGGLNVGVNTAGHNEGESNEGNGGMISWSTAAMLVELDRDVGEVEIDGV